MRSIVSVLVLGLAPLVGAAVVEPSPAPVAFVSLQKITAEATVAKAATTQLEMLRQDKAREASARQKALEAIHQQVVETGGIFSRSKHAQLVADEDRQRADLQRFTDQAQHDLQTLQRQLQTDVHGKVAAALDDIAKTRHLQVVLNEDSTVVWSVPGLDLTADVVSRLNAGR